MELKDIVEPKWALQTHRGWGMLITFLSTGLPFVNVYAQQWLGHGIDPGVVSLLGEAGARLIDDIGIAVGVCVWVYGTFFPTAPITVLPPKKA